MDIRKLKILVIAIITTIIISLLNNIKISSTKTEELKVEKSLNKNISSQDDCITNNKICLSGTKVNVRVNNFESYDFYVIGDTGNDLTLLMDRNLGNNVAWISEQDYISTGKIDWTHISESNDIISGNNEVGPLTALK